MRSCQKITELVSKKLDTSLAFTAQMELKMHLMFCKNCQRYAQQLHSIQSLLVETKDNLSTTLPLEAKVRIEKNLKQAQKGHSND